MYALSTCTCLYDVFAMLVSLCLSYIVYVFMNFTLYFLIRCLTCSQSESDAICINCAQHCHKDHSVQFIRHDRYIYIHVIHVRKNAYKLQAL